MSGAKKDTPKGFSGFDKMSTKELEEFLYMDSKMPAGATDVDAILYISKLLADREWQSQKERDAMVRNAWESFNKNYRPEPGEHVPLYEDAEEPDDNLHIQLISPDNRRKRILSRIACIAIICVGLLTIGTATAYAFGIDVFQVVAEWSSEQFHLARGDGYLAPGREVQINPELEELHALLKEHQVNVQVAPTYLPEGFIQNSVDIQQIDGCQSFLGVYVNDDRIIGIRVEQRLESELTEMEYEKNDIAPESYFANGIEHHIVYNMGQYIAVWANGEYECSIWGDMEKDTLEAMIDSIYYKE